MRRLLFASVLLVLALAPIPAFAQAVAPSVASITRSQTLLEGRSLTLSVSADGTLPFTFQWRKDGADIAGATTTSHVISPIRQADAGSYTVAITNSAGTTISDPVLIAVTAATPPYFYYQSTTASFIIGKSLTLGANVNGSDPLTFVWKKDGVVIAGASSYYYEKANTTADDAGVYNVTVSNIAGTVTSNDITVTATAPSAPAFTSQPMNIQGDPGSYESVYFSVSGTGPFTYELLKGETVISSGSSSWIRFHPLKESDAGTYKIRVTNSVGTATSNPFTVAVNPPKAPKISSSSTSVNLKVGQSLYLSSNLSEGTPPLTYQWYKDEVAITGATDYSYSKSNVQLTDAGNYKVTATNSVGSATSGTVNVSITSLQAPLITTHPASGAFYRNAWVSLHVGASGESLSYQWRKDGVAIPGATSSSYYISSFVASDAASYTVTVTNSLGSATSDAATLALLPNEAPVITRQPAGMTAAPGNGLDLSVGATGQPQPTYQWRKDGVNITGATSSSYWISSPAASDSGSYSVVVTNTEGSVTSAVAEVTVTAVSTPRILRQPASRSALPGDYFDVRVEVENSHGCTYVWKKNGEVVTGASSNSVYVSSAQPSHAGTYTVTITNAAGSVTSEAAEIRVDTNLTRPVISFSSGSQAGFTGNSIYFSIGTSVTATSIQWRLDGVAIPNATSGSLGFTANAGTVGTYTAVVTVGSTTHTSPEMKFTLLDTAQAPSIRRQPAGQRINANGSAWFDVQANGTQPLAYQWRKDGINLPLATNSYLSLSSVTASNTGSYSVNVSNAHGSVTSASAELTLLPSRAPVIVRHPVSRAVSSSNYSFDLSVDVIGSTPLTYQWYKDGAAIAGASSSYYYRSINSTAPGTYHVVVTNSEGTVTSATATITLTAVATGPSFTLQPASASAFAGASASFSATATGRGTITYQWRKNGAPIAGATSSTLTLTNVSTGDAGTYTVLATDSDGATSSQPATLTVQGGTAPSITSHPADVYVTPGTNVTFSASAAGSPAPTVQWHHNGNAIAGATSTTLTLNNAQSSHAGTYTMVATNGAGSATSRGATLTLLSQPAAAPVFTQHPISLTVAPGRAATFTAAVTGSPTPSVQWLKNGHTVPGATSTTLTFNNVQAADAGTYTLIAANVFGTATSHEATLTVGTGPIAAYFGQIGVNGSGGSWALLVMSDNTAYLLAILPERQQAISVVVTVNADGSFSFGGATTASSLAPTAVTASCYYTGPGEMKIGSDGVVTGKLTALNLTLTGTVAATGATNEFLGYYSAVPMYTAAGEVSTIASGDGRCFTIVADGSIATGGAGTLANGAIEVKLGGTTPVISGTLSRSTGSVSGSAHLPGRAALPFTAPAISGGKERLSNLSTRALAGSGDNTLIVGFYVGGTSGKGVLVRVAGPAIASQVSGTISNPRLLIYKGDQSIFENDDWHRSPTSVEKMNALALKVGAVPFPAGSKDAALDVGLSPGPYTLHVSNVDGGTGIALVELYEIEEGGGTAPRLLNLSSRSHVGRGDDVLIVGLYVNGDAPRRYLLRGVGPTLEELKVTGVLADPKLQLVKDGVIVRENDNWSEGADAADIALAAAENGAYPLPVGSKDAAMLVYLMPGAYTAIVRGVGDTTGVALVEAYEVK